MPGNKTIPILKALFTVLVWGASFIATKIALRSFQPITLVWLRFAAGTLVLGAFVIARRQFALPRPKDLLYFAILGFLGVTFHHWAQATGLATSQAGTASWIISTTPIFIAIFGLLLLKEKLAGLRILGIVLAALGVLLVVSKGDLLSLWAGKSFTRGDLLIMTNPPNWAFFTVISRRGLRDHPPARMMLCVMGLGWLFTTPFLLLDPGGLAVGKLALDGLLAVGFLGVICSGLGYIFWYDALQVMPAAQLGAFQYIQPLVTVVVAALLLDEKLLPASLLGGGIILLGVWLVNRPRNHNG